MCSVEKIDIFGWPLSASDEIWETNDRNYNVQSWATASQNANLIVEAEN